MKLIENPIRLNFSLHKSLPYTMRYLYGKSNVKTFRLYTLGSVHVYSIEAFDKLDIVMTHEHRNIKQTEVDFVLSKLLPNDEPQTLKISHSAKAEIEGDLHKKIRVKDLVIIEKPLSSADAS